jgi:hypothetical protein
MLIGPDRFGFGAETEALIRRGLTTTALQYRKYDRLPTPMPTRPGNPVFNVTTSAGPLARVGPGGIYKDVGYPSSFLPARFKEEAIDAYSDEPTQRTPAPLPVDERMQVLSPAGFPNEQEHTVTDTGPVSQLQQSLPLASSMNLDDAAAKNPGVRAATRQLVDVRDEQYAQISEAGAPFVVPSGLTQSSASTWPSDLFPLTSATAQLPPSTSAPVQAASTSVSNTASTGVSNAAPTGATAPVQPDGRPVPQFGAQNSAFTPITGDTTITQNNTPTGNTFASQQYFTPQSGSPASGPDGAVSTTSGMPTTHSSMSSRGPSTIAATSPLFDAVSQHVTPFSAAVSSRTGTRTSSSASTATESAPTEADEKEEEGEADEDEDEVEYTLPEETATNLYNQIQTLGQVVDFKKFNSVVVDVINDESVDGGNPAFRTLERTFSAVLAGATADRAPFDAIVETSYVNVDAVLEALQRLAEHASQNATAEPTGDMRLHLQVLQLGEQLLWVLALITSASPVEHPPVDMFRQAMFKTLLGVQLLHNAIMADPDQSDAYKLFRRITSLLRQAAGKFIFGDVNVVLLLRVLLGGIQLLGSSFDPALLDSGNVFVEAAYGQAGASAAAQEQVPSGAPPTSKTGMPGSTAPPASNAGMPRSSTPSARPMEVEMPQATPAATSKPTAAPAPTERAAAPTVIPSQPAPAQPAPVAPAQQRPPKRRRTPGASRRLGEPKPERVYKPPVKRARGPRPELSFTPASTPPIEAPAGAASKPGTSEQARMSSKRPTRFPEGTPGGTATAAEVEARSFPRSKPETSAPAAAAPAAAASAPAAAAAPSIVTKVGGINGLNVPRGFKTFEEFNEYVTTKLTTAAGNVGHGGYRRAAPDTKRRLFETYRTM